MREGGKPRKPSDTPRKPFIYTRVNPDLLPLAALGSFEGARQVRKAMIQTVGLTREAYERNLEDMVRRKQEDNQALGLLVVSLEERVERMEAIIEEDTARIAALSYRLAEIQANAIMGLNNSPNPEGQLGADQALREATAHREVGIEGGVDRR